MQLISKVLLFTALVFGQSAFASDLLRLLKSGSHVALMRHALAPGGGDPAEFSLRDCSTQRNLDKAGRTQSVVTGGFFRQSGILFETVYSSQWCRCLETAELLNNGPVVELPSLNSFFRSMHLADQRTALLQRWLATETFAAPVILVTHQVNITALTGVYPASGEVVIAEVLNDGQVRVKGRIDPQ